MTRTPVVLGLDFGGTKIAAAACGLDGRRLGAVTISAVPAAAMPPGTGGAQGARASFDRGVRAVRDLLEAAAPGAVPAAVGVSTFGIPFEDRVELAPTIPGWEELPLGRELRAAFPGVPVRMATDAKAAALAELRWGALADSDPAIYLNLGTGLSAALVIGGQVLSGANGAAGEIGYNLRSLRDVGVPLAARVMLEDMVSGQALARRAAAAEGGGAGPAAGTTAGGEAGPDATTSARAVFAAAAHDPGLDRLVSDFTDELALHVVNLAISVNPARIAVGGGLTGSWDRLRPRLARALAAGTPFPPELVPARFPADAPLLGALALAADAAGVRWPAITWPAEPPDEELAPLGTLTERLQ